MAEGAILKKGRGRQIFAAAVLLAGLAVGALAGAAATPLSPRHKKWLEEEVVYIISDDEKKIFRALPTEAERDQFIERFWLDRDPTPGTPENEYQEEHYRRIEYANQYFSGGRGHDGWRTDRGRIYIVLGKPAQTSKYPWHDQVRPMELWFYSSTHPSLPGFFYVLFFQADDASDYRLYSPVIDGPTKLAKGSGTENNPRGAFRQLLNVNPEVARASLSLLTDEPIDTENFTATMASDALLTRIFNLPNDRFTKEMIQRRQELKEVVKTRVTFNPEALEVHWAALREPDGETAVHLMLLLPVTLEELAAYSKDRDKYYVSARVSALVRTAAGVQLFQQSHSGTYTYEPADYERLRQLPFAYEDKLPLPPGEYDVDFVFHNEISGNYYLARQRLSVPALTPPALSVILPYEEAQRGEKEEVAEPFEFFHMRFVPAARTEFGRGEKLKVFFQVYLPQGGASYGENDVLDLDYTLGMPTGGGVRESEQEQIRKQEFDVHGTVLHGRSFSLNELPPGSYRLVVQVTDPATKATAAQTFAFKVLGARGDPGRTTISNGRLQEDTRLGWLDYRRALCEAGEQRFADAQHYFERALERNPNLAPARDQLAALFFRQGDYARVTTLAQKATITPETSVEAASAYIESLERTGNLPKAIEVGEQALAVLASSSALYEQMASLYERAGQVARAEQMREQARRASAPPPTSNPRK